MTSSVGQSDSTNNNPISGFQIKAFINPTNIFDTVSDVDPLSFGYRGSTPHIGETNDLE